MSTTPVMLVGSVPLANTETVLAAAARAMGDRLARFPDGETGVRRNWIAWQFGVFAGVHSLEQTGERARDYQLRPPFKLRDGYRAADIRFPPLGFAREANASFGAFRRLKAEGHIHQDAKFMVALPTPWAPVYSFIAYEWQNAIEPVYERALLDELNQILAALPHDDLAIQWDVATEMSWWERVYPAPFEAIEEGVLAELTRLGAAVPPDVQLGFHLCYGSMDNRHWKDPVDTANLVAIANGLIARVPRTIDFLHMPVPQDRADDAYFAALEQLALPEACELYLGLLHLDDGIEGALRRIAAARRHAPRFGIACECGLGRRPADVIPAWLELHEQVARAADSNDANERDKR